MKFKNDGNAGTGKSSNVLIFNCGSSSVKYQIIGFPSEEVLVRGEAEKVGASGREKSYVKHQTRDNKPVLLTVEMKDYPSAFGEIMKFLEKDFAADSGLFPDAIGHRYVHTGDHFNRTTLITPGVLKILEKTVELAPVHNPVSLNIIRQCLKRMPDLPEYLVVDTAFHSTIPRACRTYPLPSALMKKYGIRKYGFHGTSHKYVMQEACRFLGVKPQDQKIISCHLGSGGSSICAISNGRSVDNTMGFTPLQGLVMNTRSGDIDPALPFYIMRSENITMKEVGSLLNKKSGLLGLTGSTRDLRDILGRIKTDRNSDTAFRMYASRVKEYIGAYYMLLKKFDVLIFTDSLGTQVPALRSLICSEMDALGIRIDERANADPSQGPMDVSDRMSTVRIIVLPTNEELMIGRECYAQKANGDPARRAS